MRVLWLTNDLPPRAGGIEQFVGNLLERVHPESTVVVGPAARGTDRAEAEGHDASRPYRTVRLGGAVLPTLTTARRTVAVARDHRAEVVVLGASWPLGELAPRLGRELGVPVVALSHGLEAGLAKVGLGRLIRRSTRGLAALTTISGFTQRSLAPHVRAARLRRLPPGVDVERFRPDVDGGRLRAAWGVPADVPLVVCLSRLVRRKGQDVLLDVWPEVRRRHPEAWLVVVGEGPLGGELERRARALGAGGHVRLTGRIAWEDLPAAYAAADLFAMPCRTRAAGTDVEGLGIVFLEAQASAVPVVVGRSGGAPEAVQDGISGTVVDGSDPAAVARAIDRWLAEPQARRAAGLAGRAWVEQRWSWHAIAATFRDLLDEVVAAAR